MIEVIGRAGPARLVKWQTGENKTIVPNIIACTGQAPGNDRSGTLS